uniref:Uncharacterized protein n=1 Tax=Nothoprocta perdicaria TaxID=30464 RepID=A0A8C6ZPS3_NOTPE
GAVSPAVSPGPLLRSPAESQPSPLALLAATCSRIESPTENSEGSQGAAGGAGELDLSAAAAQLAPSPNGWQLLAGGSGTPTPSKDAGGDAKSRPVSAGPYVVAASNLQNQQVLAGLPGVLPNIQYQVIPQFQTLDGQQLQFVNVRFVYPGQTGALPILIPIPHPAAGAFGAGGTVGRLRRRPHRSDRFRRRARLLPNLHPPLPALPLPRRVIAPSQPLRTGRLLGLVTPCLFWGRRCHFWDHQCLFGASRVFFGLSVSVGAGRQRLLCRTRLIPKGSSAGPAEGLSLLCTDPKWI